MVWQQSDQVQELGDTQRVPAEEQRQGGDSQTALFLCRVCGVGDGKWVVHV